VLGQNESNNRQLSREVRTASRALGRKARDVDSFLAKHGFATRDGILLQLFDD